MKTYAIIPAYNEEGHITEVIEKTKAHANNIIVIDDGSTDKTYDIAKKTGVIVLKHVINLGKGAALKTGCDYAIKNGANILINLDSDGQHDPNEIPKFLEELKTSDLVKGVRQFGGDMPFIKRAWNFGISRLFSILYGKGIYDQQCGFRVLTAETYKKIRWKSTDYLVETEILVNLLKVGLKLKEVPIKTIYLREHGGVNPTYGFRHLAAMLLWRL